MVRTTSQVSNDPRTKRPDPHAEEKKKQAEKAAAQKERQARLSSNNR